MRPKLNPNYPSTGVLVFTICAGLIALAVGIGNISTVREGLATEQVYSVAVVFGVGEIIEKNRSPVAYWMMMGIYGTACVGGVGLGVCVPIATIRAYAKKLERRRRERADGAHH